MGGKLSPIIIGVLVAVVIAIGLLIYSILTGETTTSNNKNQTSTEEEIKPTITLSKDTGGEEKPKKVTIVVNASIEDGSGIKEIILPGKNNKVVAESTTYEVTENGNYEFTAVANNGQRVTMNIDVTEIEEISAYNPYVPEGFSVIEDSVEDGFVIEDGFGNQYVWVPVENGKLTRDTEGKVNYNESNSTASALVNSVAKYYGYYIGRVEASQYEKDGETVAASMIGKVPWTNITFLDALDYSNKSAEIFGYTDCYTSILNSYALDTALLWINKSYENYSSSTNYGNYGGTIYPTGKTEQDQVKRIFDLAGNVREWTTEIYKEIDEDTSNRKNDELNLIQRVVRSGGANLRKTPASRGGYPENSVDTYWGFRLILYK